MIIGYSFGIADGGESKFATQQKLITLNIFKYKYYVNKSCDMSRDHFVKSCKLLTSWWLVYENDSSSNSFLIHIKYF